MLSAWLNRLVWRRFLWIGACATFIKCEETESLANNLYAPCLPMWCLLKDCAPVDSFSRFSRPTQTPQPPKGPVEHWYIFPIARLFLFLTKNIHWTYEIRSRDDIEKYCKVLKLMILYCNKQPYDASNAPKAEKMSSIQLSHTSKKLIVPIRWLIVVLQWRIVTERIPTTQNVRILRNLQYCFKFSFSYKNVCVEQNRCCPTNNAKNVKN